MIHPSKFNVSYYACLGNAHQVIRVSNEIILIRHTRLFGFYKKTLLIVERRDSDPFFLGCPLTTFKVKVSNLLLDCPFLLIILLNNCCILPLK